jgi:hypothetical protein
MIIIIYSNSRLKGDVTFYNTFNLCDALAEFTFFKHVVTSDAVSVTNIQKNNSFNYDEAVKPNQHYIITTKL